MTNYWIKGTSTNKYANEFLSVVTNNNLKAGDKFTLYVDVKNQEFQFIHFGNVIFEKNKSTTFNQYMHVWKGLGVICEMTDGVFVITHNIGTYEDIIRVAKATSLMMVEDKKMAEFRFSTLVNVLFYAGVLSMYELKEKGVKNSKDTLRKQNIDKEISQFEKTLSKDRFYMKEAKEAINGYTSIN